MEGVAVVLNEENDLMDLPPGFRFHPKDEEIITHYLSEKVMNNGFSAKAIGEVDMNKCEPWDLPKRGKMGGKEWFFFTQRDRKYPTGMRTNRATESGYWKATGKDKEIYRGKGCLVGMKKTLVFYKGRAPKGEKTNWVMHEYRLEGTFSYYNFPKGPKDEWVVCKVFHKNGAIRRDVPMADSFLDHILDSPSSLPPLMDLPSSINTHEEDEFKGASASSPYFSTALNNNNNNSSNYEAALKNISYQASSSHNPIPNYLFNPQVSLPHPNFLGNYHHQERSLGSIMSYLGAEIKPVDQANSSISAVNQGISDQETQCKVEQFSSNNSLVSPSQETGISNNDNMNTEISSLMIKRDIGSNRSFEDLQGLDSLWDY